MRRNLVIGNWKMHGSQAKASDLLTELKQHLPANSATCDVAVCPPAILIAAVADILDSCNIAWGAQNLHAASDGAFTGEISASMLADYACKYVIVGHSERRSLFSESNTDVAEKFVAAQKAGITPVLCLGESLEQREKGETLTWIAEQLESVVNIAGINAFNNAVIAYEPVWAIGTGKTATPEQAQEVHAFIRQQIKLADAEIAGKVQILYGGSVNAKNAAELFVCEDIDGALVGGASLKAEDFATICKAAPK